MKILPPYEYDALSDPMDVSELEQLMDEVGYYEVVKATTTLRQRVCLYINATESGMDEDQAMELYGLDVCYPPGVRPQLYIKILKPNNSDSKSLH